MRARRLTTPTTDPLRLLAAAVVQQAIFDARGQVLGAEAFKRDYLQAHARHWLKSGGADAYLSLLGLDAGAVGAQLG